MKPAWNTLTGNMLLIAAFGLFILGVFSPLMTVKTWFLFANTFSLVSGLTQLVQARHSLLFLIVVTFSLLLPLVKMGLVAFVTNASFWTNANTSWVLHWLSLCGKWSMIEVWECCIEEGSTAEASNRLEWLSCPSLNSPLA